MPTLSLKRDNLFVRLLGGVAWNARIEHDVNVPMPTPLHIRRTRRFRPCRYTARHKEIIQLLIAGWTRSEIASVTGYSLSHVSRITKMDQARRDIASRLAHGAIALMAARAKRLCADPELQP